MADYSERTKRRLRLAAGLLRGSGVALDMPRGAFYDAVLAMLQALPPERKGALKADVDWLEAYELAEDQHWSSPSRKKEA